MKEETRIIRRVGGYSTQQAYPEDCKRCHDAALATVIIDGLCLNCFEEAVVEKHLIIQFINLTAPSLSLAGQAQLEIALSEFVKARHIPLDIDKISLSMKCNCGLQPEHPVAYHDSCCQVCGGQHLEDICPVATDDEKKYWRDKRGLKEASDAK